MYRDVIMSDISTPQVSEDSSCNGCLSSSDDSSSPSGDSDNVMGFFPDSSKRKRKSIIILQPSISNQNKDFEQRLLHALEEQTHKRLKLLQNSSA